MEKKSKCKICRRAGEKLFLKGDKCNSPKCPFLRKSYPPGSQVKKKRSGGEMSGYGRELNEARKVKNIYNISDRQFQKYVKEALKARESADASQYLFEKLEKRLDNIIFRVGIADSRSQARQIINHGHFKVNNRRIDIPSYEVNIGDEITPTKKFQNSEFLKRRIITLKDREFPSWLEVDKKTLKIKVKSNPKVDDLGYKIDLPLIISFYSR